MANSGTARHETLPRCWYIQPNGADDAEAGNDHSARRRMELAHGWDFRVWLGVK